MVDIIAAVKAWIDRYTGKTFEAVSETRYYDSKGGTDILIDAFVGSPTVVILSENGSVASTLTEGSGSDYLTLPFNSTEKNIIRLTGLGSYSRFPSGRRLKVTANFGFSTTVPADVQLAATKLAASLLQDGNQGIITSVRLGDYSATYATLDEKAEALGITNTLDLYRDIDV
jgi:hypothetical protein